MKRNRLKIHGILAAGAVALGLIFMTPGPASAKTRVGVGIGVNLGDYGLGTGTYLQFGYGRYHHGSSWSVGLGVAGPPYYYSYAPGYAYYSYRPRVYYSRPYNYRHGYRGHGPAVVHYRAPYRAAPRYYSVYVPPPATTYYAPGYATGGGVTVTGVYGSRHNAFGLGVTIPLASARPPAPRTDRQIVSGPPVEQNQIMKRVWIPGQYTTIPSSASAQTASSPGQRVWEPGHWEYVPDTQ